MLGIATLTSPYVLLQMGMSLRSWHFEKIPVRIDLPSMDELELICAD